MYLWNQHGLWLPSSGHILELQKFGANGESTGAYSAASTHFIDAYVTYINY